MSGSLQPRSVFQIDEYLIMRNHLGHLFWDYGGLVLIR